MNEEPKSREEMLREQPKVLLDALAVVASYGAGNTGAAIKLEDGRTMSVEAVVFDITGWEQET